jgi:hypothetical protein
MIEYHFVLSTGSFIVVYADSYSAALEYILGL